MLCRVAAVERFPVHHQSSDYISGHFGSLSLFRIILKIEFYLSQCIGGVTGVADLRTGHEQTQYNRVCYFHLFGVFLACKGSYYSELINFIQGSNSAVENDVLL